jgi:hypothetical protein
MATMSAHASYLRDLGFELRRQAEAARARARANPNDAFVQVEAHAFYTVVSLMRQQADAFGLSFRDLAFDGFNAERNRL